MSFKRSLSENFRILSLFNEILSMTLLALFLKWFVKTPYFSFAIWWNWNFKDLWYFTSLIRAFKIAQFPPLPESIFFILVFWKNPWQTYLIQWMKNMNFCMTRRDSTAPSMTYPKNRQNTFDSTIFILRSNRDWHYVLSFSTFFKNSFL
jgi:hypothetical protein